MARRNISIGQHPQQTGKRSSDIVKTLPATANVPYYVRALALGIPAILLGIQLSGWLGFIPVIRDGHFDFRAFYTAGYMVRSGQARKLYDYDAEKAIQDSIISHEQIALPFVHPAYEAVLFVPFSLLTWRTAYFAFLLVNLLLLAVSFRLLCPQMENIAHVYRWLPAALFLSFLPIATTLMQSQDSILVVALLATAAVFLNSNQEFVAGMLVGIGLFRFQIVIPIALLFLLWRRWRFSAGFALSTIAVAGASLWLVGLSQSNVYLHSLLSKGLAATKSDQFKYVEPIARMANLRGLIFGLGGDRFPSLVLELTTIVLSLAVLLWLGHAAKRLRGVEALAVSVTSSALVSYHLLIHDLSVLVIPIAFALDRFIGAEAAGDSGRLVARAAALMFVAPICMSFIPNLFYLVSVPLLAFLFVWAERFRAGKQWHQEYLDSTPPINESS